VAGIGKVKIKLHRPHEGRVKQVRVVRKSDGHWYAPLTCAEVPPRPLPATGQSVGVDVGITHFAALSDGSMVANPRCFEQAEREIATASRRVARRQKGSAGRKEAVGLLGKVHAKVAARRRQFHHETARALVARFDAICVEDLNVKGLARGRLAKQVRDAGWAAFFLITANKAESAGRVFEKVEAWGTSQECSGCGEVVRKGRHVRVHQCPRCGLVLDRDTNAARNVKGRGTAFVEGRAAGSPEKREAPPLPKGREGSCHTLPADAPLFPGDPRSCRALVTTRSCW
jgi:putative transposase